MNDQQDIILCFVQKELTPNEFLCATGYSIDYIRRSNRKRKLKCSKDHRSLLIDFNDPVKSITQTQRNLKACIIRLQDKFWRKSNIIKIFKSKPTTSIVAPSSK